MLGDAAKHIINNGAGMRLVPSGLYLYQTWTDGLKHNRWLTRLSGSLARRQQYRY